MIHTAIHAATIRLFASLFAPLPSSDIARYRTCLLLWLLTGHTACAHSLAGNNITNYGKDMSAVIKLAEVLPQTSINSLKCAACLSV